jgi:hypothetical protein
MDLSLPPRKLCITVAPDHSISPPAEAPYRFIVTHTSREAGEKPSTVMALSASKVAAGRRWFVD